MELTTGYGERGQKCEHCSIAFTGATLRAWWHPPRETASLRTDEIVPQSYTILSRALHGPARIISQRNKEKKAQYADAHKTNTSNKKKKNKCMPSQLNTVSGILAIYISAYRSWSAEPRAFSRTRESATELAMIRFFIKLSSCALLT